MAKRFVKMMKDEKGQGLAEYALILVLVAIVCIAGLNLLAPQINTALSNIAAAL